MDTSAVEIRALDHTADVGFDVVAGTLETLFTAAARALFMAILGDEDDETGAEDHGARTVVVECTAADTAELLVAWLRELLWLHQDQNLVFRDARYERLGEHEVRAHVVMVVAGRPPVREIKGVTYHDLDVRWIDGRAHARIILDV
ncbi:MAG: archease [Gemmatimonadetes bacterium]|nr:archease [Gemmatimonadota bacterium]